MVEAKAFHQQVMRRLLQFGELQPVVRDLVDVGAGVGHDDRRVGADDELRSAFHELFYPAQHIHLPRRREGGLGLVEDIEPVPAEPVFEQAQEAFAVRLPVERLVAVIAVYAVGYLVDFGGDVVETFGTQEIAVARLQPASEHEVPV